MIISSSVRDLCAESFEPVLKQRSRDEIDSARTLQGWVLALTSSSDRNL